MDEKTEIKFDGAKAIKNSGRGIRKGDAELDNFLIDYKDYTGSFTLNRDKWLKHSKDAWRDGHKVPIFAVTLNPKVKKDIKNVKVGIVPWDYLMNLMANYNEGEE